jgi:hypothetical protein
VPYHCLIGFAVESHNHMSTGRSSSLPRCQTYAVDTRELDLTIVSVTLEPVLALANDMVLFSHACTSLVDEAKQSLEAPAILLDFLADMRSSTQASVHADIQ